MAKKYKIKDQDYYEKGDIQIEISEEIVTPVRTETKTVTVASIENTITFLKSKKENLIAEIDAEIKENQDILDKMQDKIDEIEILERPASPNI